LRGKAGHGAEDGSIRLIISIFSIMAIRIIFSANAHAFTS
jgi:hypothetical protein